MHALLNDGSRMPWLGLGAYRIAAGKPCLQAVTHALSVGYRHIDTAAFYGNEEDVGRAVRESGIAREKVFVVTKLWNSDQGYASAIRACDQSLAKLKLDYIDLYLIHWPEPRRRLDSWRALVELRKQGKCRSIGVSNYTIAHLQELMAHSDVVPSVNQVEFSPFLFQRELLDFCRVARHPARSLLPAHARPEAGRSGAARRRGPPRQDTGPGRSPLGATARGSGHSQVGTAGADRRERRSLRFQAGEA